MNDFPEFAVKFINNLRLRNRSMETIDGYIFELKHFFSFLCEHREDPSVFPELSDGNSEFTPLPSTPQEISIIEFQGITHWHIQNYLAYVKREHQLAPRSLARKQAAIKSLYSYLFRKDLISSDVSKKLDPISIPKEEVIAMEPNEVATLIELIESGKWQTAHQQRYTQYTLKRDLAIMLTFLGSGLRLMELQRLNIKDVKFDKNEFRVLGKRNKVRNQPFNTDTRKAIQEYLTEERPRLGSKGNPSDALFLSLQGQRITRRAIQKLVEKFMKVLSNEDINTEDYTTHKLRSTCATLLLRETGNLPLVQDYLDHEDPKTTRKYAKIVSDELRRASELIKFK